MTRRMDLPPRLSATLVLVRHGESTWIAEGRFQGRLNPPLSVLGQRQAALVAQRLAEERPAAVPIPPHAPSAVFHSPLRRAADTAEAIAAAQRDTAPLRPMELLTELAQGAWEGLPHAEVSARWPSELAAWRASPATAQAPGGEPLTAAVVRVRTALEEILAAVGPEPLSEQPPADTTRIAGDVASLRSSPVPGYPASAGTQVTDGDRWAVVVAHDGIFRLILMTLLGLPLERFWSFPFSLCAISVIAVKDGVAVLRAHNLSDHLAPLADEARAAAEARGDRRGAL